MGKPISLTEDQQVDFLLGEIKVRPRDLTPSVSARVLLGVIENITPVLKYLSLQPFVHPPGQSNFCDFEGWGARIQVHRDRVVPETVQVPEPMRRDEHCLLLSQFERKGSPDKEYCNGLYVTRKGGLFLCNFRVDSGTPNLHDAVACWLDAVELGNLFKDPGWKLFLPEILETIDQRFEWEMISRRNRLADLADRRDRMNSARRRMGLIA